MAIKSIADFTILKKVFYYFKKVLGNNIQKEYAQVCNLQPDFFKKFIYLPLHYQPERTTSPTGGVFVDQILMIEILSASLPDGWVIYVKEHPIQWSLFGLNYTDYRYQGFYKKIAQIKAVQLVPVKTDTFFLTEHSQAVATVTGTAGWEAVLRSKPALIFGHTWYSDCPGIFRINDVASCRAALKKIAADYQVDQRQVINYLKSFDQATFHDYTKVVNIDGSIRRIEQKDSDVIPTILTWLAKNEKSH